MPLPVTEGNADLVNNEGQKLATVKIRPLGQYYKHNISTLSEADGDEMIMWGEEQLQLLENCRYEYIVSDKSFTLQVIEGLVTKSAFNHSTGTIETGSNIGLLVLQAEDDKLNIAGRISLEVRSSKLDYRQHYRKMLEDITDKCADLLMQVRSPASGLFYPDPRESSEIMAQRFSFLKHLLTAKDFEYAVTQILADPHSKLINESNKQEIGQGFKPTNAVLKQFRSSQSQRSIPCDHVLSSKLKSIPTHLLIHTHKETSDTSENQFVKYALESFLLVFSEMQEVMEKRALSSPSDNRLLNDIKLLKVKVYDIILHSFFRRISAPQALNLGSPVLQNKSGYREILIAWLRFNAAARLVWAGGEEIYGGGKKDVAVLYEYWVFFKLLETVQSTFNLPPANITDLIEKTSDGFGLKLKAGKSLLIKGNATINGRRLWVKFSYNRVYNRNPSGNDEDNYPSPGSWTQIMRPDYSLSLWPFEFSEFESETEEVITHIHFDAKYKINTPVELLYDPSVEEPGENITGELESRQKDRSAKRTDFLTLHSYRDAIRRTDGAYLIYPGDKSKKWQSYHELLPGIGAFALRPENADYGLADIARFLNEAALHISNRATMRERVRLWTAKSYAQKPVVFDVMLPELIFNSQVVHPEECMIIVFSVLTENQLAWIVKNNKLIIPLKMGNLHDLKCLNLNLAVINYSDYYRQIFNINKGNYELVNSSTLKLLGYPNADNGQQYLSFEIRREDKYINILNLISSVPEPGFFKVSNIMEL